MPTGRCDLSLQVVERSFESNFPGVGDWRQERRQITLAHHAPLTENHDHRRRQPRRDGQGKCQRVVAPGITQYRYQHRGHGPGQRVVYTMLDLKTRGTDVRQFVRDLEAWVIDSLAEFGVTGERREGRVGIWVPGATEGSERKIAAIGIRVRHWVTFHGIAINVNPELEHFSGIVPCGISDYGVTSLTDLGIDCSMEDVDTVLKSTFLKKFS